MKEKTCFVVGLGKVFNIHKKVLNSLNIDIKGYIDNDKNKLNDMRKGYNHVFSSLVEAFRESNPFFWDICVPNENHLDVIKEIASLDEKANIFVEKPICEYSQINDLREIINNNPGLKISVNENYLSSNTTKEVRKILNEKSLKPHTIISEMSKHRGEDFANGRFVDKKLYVWGYEGTHMLTMVWGLGDGYKPDEIKSSKMKDAYIETIEGIKKFEKQGEGEAEYITQNGKNVLLRTSMVGEFKYLYPPHGKGLIENKIPQSDRKTRYRVLIAKCHNNIDLVAFYDPVQGLEAGEYPGSVVVIKNGQIDYIKEPIPDNTMFNHISKAVNHFSGKEKNPCDADTGILNVETLDKIVSKALRQND